MVVTRWVVEVVLCIAWSRHGNRLVRFLVTVDMCYGFPSRLHCPWLAMWTALRCHTPNRFGTVNMEDNVNIK